MLPDEVRGFIRTHFGENSPKELVFAALLGRLTKETSGFVKLEEIRSWLVPQLPTREVDLAVLWLSSPALPVLEMRWRYVPEEDDEGFDDIDPIEVSLARSTRRLELPDGSHVKDFEEDLFPYFRASPMLQKMLESLG